MLSAPRIDSPERAIAHAVEVLKTAGPVAVRPTALPGCGDPLQTSDNVAEIQALRKHVAELKLENRQLQIDLSAAQAELSALNAPRESAE